MCQCRSPCKPHWHLPAGYGAENGAGGDQSFMDTRGPQRPRGGEFFVGAGEYEAPPVVFARLLEYVRFVCVIAEARNVHCKCIHARLTLNNPASDREADTAALRESRHDA